MIKHHQHQNQPLSTVPGVSQYIPGEAMLTTLKAMDALDESEGMRSLDHLRRLETGDLPAAMARYGGCNHRFYGDSSRTHWDFTMI